MRASLFPFVLLSACVSNSPVHIDLQRAPDISSDTGFLHRQQQNLPRAIMSKVWLLPTRNSAITAVRFTNRSKQP
jgi:hypothetical protein